MLLSKEKEDLEVPSIIKRRNKYLNQKLQHPILILQMIKILMYSIIYLF